METPEWLTKPQASAVLGISIRKLEQLMHDGRLPFAYVKGRTNKRAVFRLADVEGLKAELGRPVYPNQRRRVVRRRTREELFEALRQRNERLERSVSRLRDDLCFVVEILLVRTGMSKADVEAWVQVNLRDQDDDP